MVVITSSAFSFMRGLTGATGPLHGRRTDQLELLPFDYFDAARFFTQLGPTDRVRAYACLGGIPAYLQFGNVGGTIADIIQRTFFNPRHFLFREGEELLRTEFHQETLYASILRAIAVGETRPSDIARAVGRNSADEIFDHLRRLIDLQYIRRDVPITEVERPRTQRVHYRLADPYLRFWFRYVAPNQSQIQLRRGSSVWDRHVAPRFDEFVARTTWEDVCIQHMWRRIASDQSPVELQQLGRWWDNTDEIDLVGTQDRRVTLIGECKWTNAPVDMRVFDNLRSKVHKLDLAKNPLWVLASRSGFEPEVRQRAEQDDLLLIEPSDLFAPELERPI
jgi:AAA+ ATPase superfamily predicted ATPase